VGEEKVFDTKIMLRSVWKNNCKNKKRRGRVM
jgi:hypothetical protein